MTIEQQVEDFNRKLFKGDKTKGISEVLFHSFPGKPTIVCRMEMGDGSVYTASSEDGSKESAFDESVGQLWNALTPLSEELRRTS